MGKYNLGGGGEKDTFAPLFLSRDGPSRTPRDQSLCPTGKQPKENRLLPSLFLPVVGERAKIITIHQRINKSPLERVEGHSTIIL